MNKSLRLFYDEVEVYSSEARWLHPLFEVETFLSQHPYDADKLYLRDKIAGKAAAFLIVKLGIKRAHIGLVSTGARAVFQRFGVHATFDTEVPAIQCRTEQLVDAEADPEAVWQMLRRRAGRVTGVDLVIENLHVFIEGKPIITNLNLHLGRGDQAIVKGPNGAGKTTLLKTILGVLPIQSGGITINNIDIRNRAEIGNKIGYVSQEKNANRFPILASEVVEIGLTGQKYKRHEMLHRVEIAMKRAGCWHLAKQSFHELSGGEKQRVSIARCFCQQAQVLLLDEPTSFLDAEAKSDLFDLLTGLSTNEAPTILMVSHDDEWIARFNWAVYELKKGQLCLNS